MKRKDLIRHLEAHGCELLREVVVTPSILIALLERLPQSHDIVR